MRRSLLIMPLFLMCFSLGAIEDDPDANYEIQEGCDEEDDVCRIPAEENRYSRRYYNPRRHSNHYDYRTQDTDASWPGKNEYSFMEEMMR